MKGRLSLPKADIRRLCAYIPFFESFDAGKICQIEEGIQNAEKPTFPYHVYEERLERFIKDFLKSSLVDHNYLDTIGAKGIKGNERLGIEIIESADLELIKAIMTYYVRQERFCDGLWYSAARDGIFLALLMRLNELVKIYE